MVWLPWLTAVLLLAWVVRAVPLTAVLETLCNLTWQQVAALVVLNTAALVWLTGRWWLLAWGLVSQISPVRLLSWFDTSRQSILLLFIGVLLHLALAGIYGMVFSL